MQKCHEGDCLTFKKHQHINVLKICTDIRRLFSIGENLEISPLRTVYLMCCAMLPCMMVVFSC